MKTKYILKKNYEFDEVIKKGKKISNDYFVIFFLEYQIIEDFLIGISVGKKYGNAPIRNKEKRRIRHMIRNNMDIIRSKHKYVVIAKKKEGTFEVKEKKLIALFERINSEKQEN